MLVTSSRDSVISVLNDFFRDGNFHILPTFGNTRTLGRIRGRPSVVLLSVGVPKASKLRIYGHVHSRVSYPVLFLATQVRSASGMGNFAINNSSCVIGPFSLIRLRTQIHTRLHQRTQRGFRTRIGFSNSLAVSCSRHYLFFNSGHVNLTGGRFSVIRLLSRDPKRIFSGRQVCRHV